jgi:hypothetical protein
MYLQSQIEGLESIFLELIPCEVELKRQQVQDFYDKRFKAATRPEGSLAENELRRQFNTKANQVRNLVDNAESLGDPVNKVNLVRAASTLPGERNRAVKGNVLQFCKSLLMENKVDPEVFKTLLASRGLGPVEGRAMLAATMFLVNEQVDFGGEEILVRDLLSRIMSLVKTEQLLPRNDPFITEARCALDAMEDEAPE